MGLFGRKKEKTKPEVLSISGDQLYTLLKKAVQLAAEDVEAKSLTFGPEIMLEYKDNIHFVGIRYDKKRAKAEKRTTFSPELMTVYLDKGEYATPEELYQNAVLDGDKFSSISEGIIVAPEFGDLL